MAKSSGGNQYTDLHRPADFGLDTFDLSGGTIRKVREVKKMPEETLVTLPNVVKQDCHQNEDPQQHEEQEEVHDSEQAGNDQTKNRLPVLEKKQMGSKTRISRYKNKNFRLQKKEEEKKFKSEHCKLLELETVENKMKQLNLEGLHQEEIVTSKKLQEYRKQQIDKKVKDYLNNKGENGVNFRSYSLSGRENNIESVEQETNQALPGQEQMQFLSTQTQAKLPNRRHTTKESDCGSLVQPRKQNVCTCGLETRSDGSNESSEEHAPTPPKRDSKRPPRRLKRNMKQPFRRTRAAPPCQQNAFHRTVSKDKFVVTPTEHQEILRKMRETEREVAELLRNLKFVLTPTEHQEILRKMRETEREVAELLKNLKFVLTPTEHREIKRKMRETEREVAELLRNLKLGSNGTTSEEEMQLKAKAISDQEQQLMKKPARFRPVKRLHQTQEQPHQQRKERTPRDTHASQMQQQHQEMQTPGQYAMLVVRTKGKTEDLSHLPSPPREEATEHPARATIRRRGQWNRNQPSSQPESFHFKLETGQSHSSEVTVEVNSRRPVAKIEAHLLNIADWSSFPKSIDTKI